MRGRGRGRERREGGGGGSIYMVCCVCCHGSSTSFHFRCVYTYAKITHTYVRLHSCVALHLALSMNAAANFCSPINNLSHLSLQWGGGGGGEGIFSPYQSEREREGGREGGREMESEWEREGEGGREYIFSALCMLSQFQAVHFMREYNICTLYVCAGS